MYPLRKATCIALIPFALSCAAGQEPPLAPASGETGPLAAQLKAGEQVNLVRDSGGRLTAKRASETLSAPSDVNAAFFAKVGDGSIMCWPGKSLGRPESALRCWWQMSPLISACPICVKEPCPCPQTPPVEVPKGDVSVAYSLGDVQGVEAGQALQAMWGIDVDIDSVEAKFAADGTMTMIFPGGETVVVGLGPGSDSAASIREWWNKAKAAVIAVGKLILEKGGGGSGSGGGVGGGNNGCVNVTGNNNSVVINGTIKC